MTRDKRAKAAARRAAAKQGISYTAARRRQDRRIEVIGEIALSQTGRPVWGVAEPAGPQAWRIHPHETAAAAQASIDQDTRVHVEYTAPGSWEPTTTELLPVVWRRPSDGRWIWATCGWAVDDPGQIADDLPGELPATELPYEVRTFSLGSRDGQTWGLDYTGSHPSWSTMAWCATRAEADLVAAVQVRWRDTAHRAQVWGPDQAGWRQLLATWDADPSLRPAPLGLPYQSPPDHPRPASPPPAAPPARRPGVTGGCPDLHLRIWSPDTGWISAGWHTMRQLANVTAFRLQVGAPGSPWQYGDIWGPPIADDDHHRVLTDLWPDLYPSEPRPLTRAHPTGA